MQNTVSDNLAERRPSPREEKYRSRPRREK